VEVIEALNNDEIDIGLGISITWKRALEVDFTQPIVDGSLRIMTRNRSGMNIWELFMPFHWTLWVSILILALVNGHIIWLVERDSNSYYFPKFYFSGIREGLWFSFMNLMSMDDGVVRSFPGKIVKFASTFTGVILIAIYTATVASLLTTGDISSRIVGPQDLIGVKVGSNYGSTASEYVAGYGGMQLILFPNAHDAFMALKGGKVPAIIMDYPVLVYYSRLYPDPSMTIVESILEYDLIGLAMRRNSTMIATLNGVIVSLTQTGYSGQLSDKWIGQPKRSSMTSYDFFDTIGLWVWMGFWCIVGVVAFLLKKYVIKKSYKKLSWYSSWGGEESKLPTDDAETPEKPLLSVRHSRRRYNQLLAKYTESEPPSESEAPPSPSTMPSLSIQEEESAYEEDIM
jgi:polar amino acid transport system substrate-binding protein